MHESLLRLAIHRLWMLRPAEKQMLDDIIDSEHFFRSLDARLLGQIIGRHVRSKAVDPEAALRDALQGPDSDASLDPALRPLLGVRPYPSRVRCATLPWKAAARALETTGSGKSWGQSKVPE